MRADFPSVEINAATVAHSPETEKFTTVWFGVSIEVAGIPYCPFIIFEFRRLRVPVAGHFKPETSVKRVFVEIGIALRLAVLIHLHAVALVVEIHYGVPSAVEQAIVPAVDVGHGGE